MELHETVKIELSKRNLKPFPSVTVRGNIVIVTCESGQQKDMAEDALTRASLNVDDSNELSLIVSSTPIKGMKVGRYAKSVKRRHG